MVKTATSLGRSGLQDWLIQRVTAMILALYFIVLLGFWASHSVVSFEAWRGLFANPWMQGMSVFALFSLVSHAWIGVWTIITDYVKPLGLRLLFQIFFLSSLLVELVWGLRIIWSA